MNEINTLIASKMKIYAPFSQRISYFIKVRDKGPKLWGILGGYKIDMPSVTPSPLLLRQTFLYTITLT